MSRHDDRKDANDSTSQFVISLDALIYDFSQKEGPQLFNFSYPSDPLSIPMIPLHLQLQSFGAKRNSESNGKDGG